MVAAVWLAIRLALSIVTGRPDHDGFGRFVMGAVLGPFGVLPAVDAGRIAAATGT